MMRLRTITEYQGPKFNQYIFDLLLQFRAYRIAITADFEKACLMISVKDEDRLPAIHLGKRC